MVIFRRTERVREVPNIYLAILMEGEALTVDATESLPPSEPTPELNESYRTVDMSPEQVKSPNVFAPLSRENENSMANTVTFSRMSEESAVNTVSEGSPIYRRSPIKHVAVPVDLSGIDFKRFSILHQAQTLSPNEFSPEKEPDESPVQFSSIPSEPEDPVLTPLSAPEPDEPLPSREEKRTIPVEEEQPAKRVKLDEEEMTPTLTPKSNEAAPSFICPKCLKGYKLRRFFDKHVDNCQI